MIPLRRWNPACHPFHAKPRCTTHRANFFCCFVLLIAGTTTATAQVPNPDYVQAVAIYRAGVGVSDSLPDNQVNYNVTDQAVVRNLFSGLESDTMRDCRLMQAQNS